MNTLVKTNGNEKRLFPTIANVPSLWDSFWNNELPNLLNEGDFLNKNGSLPAVNIHEQNNRYQLEVAAPGMTKEDFSIKLDNNMLTVSAEKNFENESKYEDGKFNRREFSYQSFRRSFRIPENLVEGDKILAKYKDGILKIDIPKTKEAVKKAARQIKIQ